LKKARLGGTSQQIPAALDKKKEKSNCNPFSYSNSNRKTKKKYSSKR